MPKKLTILNAEKDLNAIGHESAKFWTLETIQNQTTRLEVNWIRMEGEIKRLQSFSKHLATTRICTKAALSRFNNLYKPQAVFLLKKLVLFHQITSRPWVVTLSLNSNDCWTRKTTRFWAQLKWMLAWTRRLFPHRPNKKASQNRGPLTRKLTIKARKTCNQRLIRHHVSELSPANRSITVSLQRQNKLKNSRQRLL